MKRKKKKKKGLIYSRKSLHLKKKREMITIKGNGRRIGGTTGYYQNQETEVAFIYKTYAEIANRGENPAEKERNVKKGII